MPRLSKVAFHNDVKFVTFNVEEDFLLCANPQCFSKIKDLVRAGVEVYRRWLRGEIHVAYPAGLFPPAMPRLVAFSCQFSRSVYQQLGKRRT